MRAWDGLARGGLETDKGGMLDKTVEVDDNSVGNRVVGARGDEGMLTPVAADADVIDSFMVCMWKNVT